MRRPPQRPGILPKGAQSVQIIGEKKFVKEITFRLAKFDFHPPVKFDQVYVMMLAVLAAGGPGANKIIHAFSGQFQMYLAEDCELGKQHDIVMVCCDEKGQLGFMVAKPVEDDPAAKGPTH